MNLQKLRDKCKSSDSNMCRIYNILKDSKESLVHIFEQLPKLSQLPPNGWLSNDDIDRILRFYQASFKNFDYFDSTTSDFLFCDFKKDIVQDKGTYQSLLERIKKGQFKYDPRLFLNKSGNKALTGLTSQRLQDLIKKGKTKNACIINTDNCYEAGKHWVCFFIDLDSGSIEFFNSTGKSHINDTVLIKKYIDYIQQILDEIGIKSHIHNIEENIQSIDGTCGVYCLLYVLCRILGFDPKSIVKSLQSNNNDKDSLVKQFRDLIFLHD